MDRLCTRLRVLALLVPLASASSASLAFTGNAVRDFGSNAYSFYVADRGDHEVRPGPEAASDLYVGSDVGVPEQLGVGVYSGFDIERVWLNYDPSLDELHVAIDCFGVCGDADGDGNPGGSSSRLSQLGGVDYPDLSRDEGFVVAIDFDGDVTASVMEASGTGEAPFDVALGVPSGQPGQGGSELECTAGATGDDYLSMQRCLGLYTYNNAEGIAMLQRFREPLRTQDGQAWPVRNDNPFPRQQYPDLEWTIERLSELRAALGVPFEEDDREVWSLRAQVFGGSFADDGIGEDFVPSDKEFFTINFPCRAADACGVCFGDNSTCTDCAGVPNGSAEYDTCDVCGGNGYSCRDCEGTIGGSMRYDACGVCGGDGADCVDCAGTPGGSAVEDWCGVCNGNGRSCADCEGVPNGSAEYDVCGVCGGDGTTCCGGDGGECCVNYGGVSDAYWNYLLLPKTLENIIDQMKYARNVLAWIQEHLPSYESLDATQIEELQIGQHAEFARMYLEDCHKTFCTASSVFYTQLVHDNAH